MGAVCCDAQGILTEVNPALNRALGGQAANSHPLRLFDLISPGERETVAARLAELMDARRDSFRLEARGTDKDRLYTEWTAWRGPETEGTAGFSLLIVEDGQEHQCAQDRFRQRERWEALGRLAAGVFHDFNNLLTGVTLNCDLLAARLESKDRERRYVDEIHSAVLQANALVRQLLVLAGQQETDCRIISLNETALGMRSLLARLIGENIALDFRLAAGLASVRMAPAQAQQILLNLVLNARDAVGEGGSIIVETSNCEFRSPDGIASANQNKAAFPCVLLVVSDNGRGMDAETRAHLFEPFFTTKAFQQGAGLGLATVRNIVSRNGGLVDAESEPGKGTRMMILLPRSAESADTDTKSPKNPENPSQTQVQTNAEEVIL